MEIIQGKPRRRWSLEEKRAIVAETFTPEATMNGVARRYDISPSMVFAWRKRFRAELGFPKSEAVPAFAAVKLIEQEPSSSPAAHVDSHAVNGPGIEIAFGADIRMRIMGTVEPALVAALVRALART